MGNSESLEPVGSRAVPCLHHSSMAPVDVTWVDVVHARNPSCPASVSRGVPCSWVYLRRVRTVSGETAPPSTPEDSSRYGMYCTVPTHRFFCGCHAVRPCRVQLCHALALGRSQGARVRCSAADDAGGRREQQGFFVSGREDGGGRLIGIIGNALRLSPTSGR